MGKRMDADFFEITNNPWRFAWTPWRCQIFSDSRSEFLEDSDTVKPCQNDYTIGFRKAAEEMVHKVTITSTSASLVSELEDAMRKRREALNTNDNNSLYNPHNDNKFKINMGGP